MPANWEEPEGQVGIIPHDCVFISGFNGFKNIACESRHLYMDV